MSEQNEIIKLDYDKTLCMTMLRYSAFKTELRPSEVKEKLKDFFPEEMIKEMVDIIINHSNKDIIFTSLTPIFESPDI